jgi:V/A-type H+/Na+-transporting ATPase subunit D
MTRRIRGLPPGRAGRMWLVRRLAVARRGGDLLEQKLRILLSEEQDFALRAERARREWAASVAELDQWTLRAAVLSGERGFRLAGDGVATQVDVSWRMTMGVRYPATVDVAFAAGDRAAFSPDNSALIAARPAAERAVRAGAEYAVASTALDSVRAEVVATRRKLRAIRERWVPRLESAMADLLVTLDDEEHAEHVRLRWASGTAQTGGKRHEAHPAGR